MAHCGITLKMPRPSITTKKIRNPDKSINAFGKSRVNWRCTDQLRSVEGSP
jgi:hypothetical protein